MSSRTGRETRRVSAEAAMVGHPCAITLRESRSSQWKIMENHEILQRHPGFSIDMLDHQRVLVVVPAKPNCIVCIWYHLDSFSGPRSKINCSWHAFERERGKLLPVDCLGLPRHLSVLIGGVTSWARYILMRKDSGVLISQLDQLSVLARTWSRLSLKLILEPYVWCRRPSLGLGVVAIAAPGVTETQCLRRSLKEPMVCWTSTI